MQLLRRLVDLLGVELACFAGPDELDGILECRLPIETAPVHLAGEGARRGVMATLPGVDVIEELTAFLHGDTLKRDPVGPTAVQVAILDAIAACLVSHSLRFFISLGELSIHQVAL